MEIEPNCFPVSCGCGYEFSDSEYGDDDCVPMPPAHRHRHEVEKWLSSVDSPDGLSDNYLDDSDD